MTTDERLDRLTSIVETLAASVVSHDDQIAANNRQLEALIEFTSKNTHDIAELGRQFQAYLNTIHPKQ